MPSNASRNRRERVIDNRASGCPVVVKMDVGDPSLRQLACEGRGMSHTTIVIDGHVELLVERCQPDADALCRSRRSWRRPFRHDTRPVHRQTRRTDPVRSFRTSWCSNNNRWRHEVRSREARIASIARSANEILDDTCHLTGFKRARHARFDHSGRAIVQNTKAMLLGSRAGLLIELTGFRRSATKRDMGHTTDMPGCAGILCCRFTGERPPLQASSLRPARATSDAGDVDVALTFRTDTIPLRIMSPALARWRTVRCRFTVSDIVRTTGTGHRCHGDRLPRRCPAV